MQGTSNTPLNTSEIQQVSSFTELEKMLNAERDTNKKSTWNKLDKSTKLVKIKEYCEEFDCDEKERIQILNLLTSALESNKLQKIKDVIYDIDKQQIKSIPMLSKHGNHFVLKSEKRQSTSKSLPTRNKVNNTKKKKKDPFDV